MLKIAFREVSKKISEKIENAGFSAIFDDIKSIFFIKQPLM
jgi:hypothetical protein